MKNASDYNLIKRGLTDGGREYLTLEMFNISEWVLLCVLELPLAWLAVSLFSFLTPAPTTTTHQDGLDDEDVHAGKMTDISLCWS